MRFMVIVKASRDSEAGMMPSTELLTAMGKFNEEMVKASVSRGPFDLTNDLVSGFWLIQTKSLDEAIGWMKRAPFDGGAEIEIRQVFSAEDFGEALTPELREQEARLRAEAARK